MQLILDSFESGSARRYKAQPFVIGHLRGKCVESDAMTTRNCSFNTRLNKLRAEAASPIFGKHSKRTKVPEVSPLGEQVPNDVVVSGVPHERAWSKNGENRH